MTIKRNIRTDRHVREAVKTQRIHYKAEQPPCWICGQPIDYDTGDIYSDEALEVDHVFPVAKRPDLAGDPENLRPSHRGCNRTRNTDLAGGLLDNCSRDWENITT